MFTGTGYLFKFRVDTESDTHIPVVITNKHVIRNAYEGRIIFSKADKNGNPDDRNHFGLFSTGFEQMWRMHPENDVDLCAMPIAPFLKQAEAYNHKLFYIALDTSLIPTREQLDDLSALEEIVMVGYPNGIWDSINNKPIFRKGVTATHPNQNYNGKKEFMIDAACIPGSSGSPVFLVNENGYSDRKGTTYIGVKRILLLGTLYAGPQLTTEGEVIVVDVPTVQRAFAFSKIPINLGLVIKSSRILELESLF